MYDSVNSALLFNCLSRSMKFTGQVSMRGSMLSVETGPKRNDSDCSQDWRAAFHVARHASSSASEAPSVSSASTWLYNVAVFDARSLYVGCAMVDEKSVNTAEFNAAFMREAPSSPSSHDVPANNTALTVKT